VRKTHTLFPCTAAYDATAADACLTACIADINEWMKASRLRLNEFKTQVMWIGTSQQLAKITVRDVLLLSTVVTVVDSVRHLGVIIDSQCVWTRMLPLSAVAAITSCGNYIRSLSTKAAETFNSCACVESTGLL